jgi:hypothetical protein
MNALKMLWDRKMLWQNVDRLRAKASGYGVNAELERLIEGFKGHEKNWSQISSGSDRSGRRLRSGDQ